MLASSLGQLAACSTGSEHGRHERNGPGPSHRASAWAVSNVGGDPNGRYQFGQGMNQTQGWP